MNKLKKAFVLVGMVTAVPITVIALLVVFSIQWMFHTWSNLTMEELVFHLQAPAGRYK